MLYNRYDVEEIVRAVKCAAPELTPYAEALEEWCEIVDTNSDGWSHWSAGNSAASRILGLLAGARFPHTWDKPSTEACAKAFSSIKSTATRHNLPQVTLPAIQKSRSR